MEKYSSNSSKECVSEVDFEYPKELRELHNDYNDYPLAADKIKIKREMLSNYQLRISDYCNTRIGNIKNLVPNFFDKEKYVFHYEILELFLEIRIKTNKQKKHHLLEFNQSQY